ncbi:uncharacterized protein LOC134566199 [Pelobates fuscus]|uniref:uncharacterized protein LOC134566199 n=1 Tax=Pelobates fuscus TaxID=191477 RepID=UPI002FE4EEA8
MAPRCSEKTDPPDLQPYDTINIKPETWNSHTRKYTLSEDPTTPKEDPKRVTMTSVVLKTFLILSGLISLTYSQNCKWLRPQQMYLNRKILQSFNQMSLLEITSGTCPQNSTVVPNIDDLYNISQVEEAAIAARDVTNQTIRFYKRNHQKLQCDEKAWERVEMLLYYQLNLLDDCIPEGAENPQFQLNISEYFISLQKIVNEEVDTCARTVVQINIKRNLQLAALLSSRMRRKHLLKNISVL